MKGGKEIMASQKQTLYNCELLYYCNYNNTECKKRSCKKLVNLFVECVSTHDIKFTQKDKNNEPIINMITYNGKLYVRFGIDMEG
jgi:hypothetical protein